MPRRDLCRAVVLPALLAALALPGCGSDEPPAPPAAAAPEATPATVRVTVGRAAPVTAEVADTVQERAVGLMGRRSVPRGTGMVFRYDAPAEGDYYMFRVPVPLTAVFARDGRVVGVVDMPPCPLAQPQACPTYGPDVPYDTVLETAPETLRGLVRAGDALRVG